MVEGVHLLSVGEEVKLKEDLWPEGAERERVVTEGRDMGGAIGKGEAGEEEDLSTAVRPGVEAGSS